MRDYIQRHVREALVNSCRAFKEALEACPPKTAFNVSPYSVPVEGCKNCSIYGKVTLGKNSRLYGCVVGENVELIVGDNTIIMDSVFLPETRYSNAYRDVSVNYGKYAVVNIGSNCVIRLLVTSTNVQLEEGCVVLATDIRRNYAASGENSPAVVHIGKNAVMCDSFIRWQTGDSEDTVLKDLIIGDNYVSINRGLGTRSSDTRIGNNVMLVPYDEALSGMLDQGKYPEAMYEVDNRDPRFVMEHLKYTDSSTVTFDTFDRVRIGNNCYISTSMQFKAIKGMESYVELGDNNIFVCPEIPDAASPRSTATEYQRVVARYKTGKDCTFSIFSNAGQRSTSRAPQEVIVKDGLNVVIAWMFENCPCNRIEITADGRYSI